MLRITLDKALESRNISRYELAKRTGIQYHVIDNYYKNKVTKYDKNILERFCAALRCTIGDIIEYQE